MGWLNEIKERHRRKEADPVESSPFSADIPITQEAQDLLGRAKFAAELAKLLSRWRAEHSLVVALRGSWGEGKSSLKNLILRALEKDEKKPKIVEFNPWRYGDSTAITTAFYAEIAVALGKTGPIIERHRRAHAFRTYGRLLSPASESAKAVGGGLAGATGWVASLGLLTVGASAVLTTLPVAQIAGWLIGFAGFLGFAGKAFQWFSGDGKPEKPLALVRHDLAQTLKKLRRPVLVIIDDIDRLEPEEIRTVFRHVKANADFPRLTYLLLFQRDIVEKALSEISGGQGRDYLEKIVQAAFDLPVVEQTRIHTAFLSILDKVLVGYINAESGFDEVRWGNVLHGGIKHYLGNLRDVHRFIAALTVHLELHRGSRVLEVNVIDFITLEALRLFEPDVFESIAANKNLLTTTHSDEGERGKARVRAIIAKASDANQPVVEELINRLFPPIRWALGGSYYGSDFVSSWSAKRRVCSAAYFDRYFSLRLEDDSISDSEMVEILESANDEIKIRETFNDLRERELLATAFRRFDDMRNQLPLEKISILLPAMMEAAEHFDARASFGIEAPFVSAWRSVFWYIRQEPDVEKRGLIFLAAIKKTDALAISGQLIDLDQGKRDKEREEDRLILTDSQLEEAKSIWVMKFKNSLTDLNASLVDHRFVSNLFHWSRFGGDDDAKVFVLGIAAKSDTFVPLLKAFRSMSTSQTIGDLVAKTQWRLNLSSLALFVDFEELKKLAAGVDLSALDDDDRSVVQELLKAKSAERRHFMDDDD